ncbi:unnamed protein product [Nesidiocoris tenuis]|uniref:Uncharacterized protein n=1 Tax=Nesidiocoris tenuis TaxID=355587 RepID=A0A6H5HTM1_9HEMI|nr:unnamed protein product [Nesidiocoris tenuis]
MAPYLVTNPSTFLKLREQQPFYRYDYRCLSCDKWMLLLLIESVTRELERFQHYCPLQARQQEQHCIPCSHLGFFFVFVERCVLHNWTRGVGLTLQSVSFNSSDLDSIRALFNEKEKELTMAVAKVEELTRQLEDVRRRRLNQPPNAPASQELERITSARDGARKYWIGGTGTGYWIGGTRMAVLDRRHRNGGIGSPVLDGGTGSAVLERRYWIGGIGSAVLDRRHWIGGTGSVVLDRRYWNSSTYWNGGTGTAVLDRRNWIGGTGKAVLDRQFRIGGTGTVHAWRRWTALGMSFLVVLVVT